MTPEVPYPLHKPEPPATYVEEKFRDYVLIGYEGAGGY